MTNGRGILLYQARGVTKKCGGGEEGRKRSDQGKTRENVAKGDKNVRQLENKQQNG
jgi:hypothetical protein